MIPSHYIWYEKYRPKTFEDLCLVEKTKKDLLKYKEDKQIPHLLFVGPVGVGKTSTARIIVENILECDYLYINASDESGIDTIRQKVSGFAQTKSFDGGIKVIILDEYDGSSPENQKCLRNLMETYASTCRFIITGNFGHKIIEALTSRCVAYDIRPTLESCLKRCLYILQKEGINTTQEQKKEVARFVKGKFPDMQTIIGMLQVFCLDGELNIEQKTGNREFCDKMWVGVTNKSSLSTRKFLIENSPLFGNDYEQLLRDLLNYIYDQKINDSTKKAMILTIADHIVKMGQVIDKEINLFACLLNLELV